MEKELNYAFGIQQDQKDLEIIQDNIIKEQMVFLYYMILQIDIVLKN